MSPGFTDCTVKELTAKVQEAGGTPEYVLEMAIDDDAWVLVYSGSATRYVTPELACTEHTFRLRHGDDKGGKTLHVSAPAEQPPMGGHDAMLGAAMQPVP